MAGAPSQLDLFDHKPELAKLEGKPLPPSVIGGQRYAFIRPDAAVLGPRFKFAKHGKCGAELSEMLPHLAKVVDDVCLIKSVHTDQFNHAPAQIFFNTGFSQPGRPSLGLVGRSTASGAETKDLPAFVVMSTGAGISGGAANWSSGFLPTVYTGVRFRNSAATRSSTSSSPPGVDAELQQDSLDLVGDAEPEAARRSRATRRSPPASPPTRWPFRLQTVGPGADGPDEGDEGDARRCTAATRTKPSFARACLLARRMVERGVRFVNIYHEGWDAHSDVAGNHKKQLQGDRPGAAPRWSRT